MNPSRVSAAEASAHAQSFFEKLRAGFTAIQEEVATAEELTAAFERQINLDRPGSAEIINTNANVTGYFTLESAQLDDIVDHYDKAIKLHATLVSCPVNIDPIENRLLALRERLLKLEENPRLLKAGYQPYLHEKSPQEVRQAQQPKQQQQEQLQQLPQTAVFYAASKGNSSEVASNKGTIKRTATPRYKTFVSTTPVDTPISPMAPTPHTLPVDSFRVQTPSVNQSGVKSTSNLPVLSSCSSSLTKPAVEQRPGIVTNKEIANCLSRLSRWNTAAATSEEVVQVSAAIPIPVPVPPLPTRPITRSCTFVKPKSPASMSSATLTTPVPSSLGSLASFEATHVSTGNSNSNNNNVPRNTTFTLPLNQLSFPFSVTPNGLLNSNGNLSSESSVLYETVEFTPGMTSRVPKNR